MGNEALPRAGSPTITRSSFCPGLEILKESMLPRLLGRDDARSLNSACCCQLSFSADMESSLSMCVAESQTSEKAGSDGPRMCRLVAGEECDAPTPL